MEQGSTMGEAADTGLFAGAAWFDPIEAGIRERVRGFIEELLEQELTAALGRGKSERASGEPKGYRNGTRGRQLLGSFGPVEVEVLVHSPARPHKGSTPRLSRTAPMCEDPTGVLATVLHGLDLKRVQPNTRSRREVRAHWRSPLRLAHQNWRDAYMTGDDPRQKGGADGEILK